MNEYYKTIRDRKNLAHQAKHRKNGSKSKKCTLSTDFLTDKQIRERNGPVMVYNLGSPMRWDEFKKLPLEYQREYLSSLVERFGVSASKVGDMLGVSMATMSRLTSKPELSFKFRAGKRQSKEQAIAWQRFLDGEGEIIGQATVDPAEPEQPQDTDFWPIEDDIQEVPKRHGKMIMDKFTLSFCGPIDVDMISNSLRQILGSDAVGSIEIGCYISKF